MKKWQIISLVIGIVFLAGCGEKTNKQSNNSQRIVKNKTEIKTNNHQNVITSIKEAMGLGKAMKCVYKMNNESGNTEVTTYVEGKKYATEIIIAGKIQHMIFDGKDIYSWTEGKKEGVKMSDDCMQGMGVSATKENNDNTENMETNQEKAFTNAVDVKCVEFKEADFSVPTNITFSDPCKTLKGMTNNIPVSLKQ